MAERCVSKRSNGEPCKGWRYSGSDKCKRHLANPKARANADLRATVLHLGFNLAEVDPGEVLLKLVAQSSRRCHELAAELERHVADSPSLREALVAQAYGEFGPTGEYVRGLAAVEAAERDRCASFAAKAIAAGLAERSVRLAERQGALIADVLRSVMGDASLGLSEEQRRVMPDVIRRHLAAVA